MRDQSSISELEEENVRLQEVIKRTPGFYLVDREEGWRREVDKDRYFLLIVLLGSW